MNNQHGVGALTEADNFWREFFYNGTIVQCDEPPQKDGLVFLEFNFGGIGSLYEQNLKFKASKKDKVNYVWGKTKDVDIPPSEWYGKGNYPISKNEPFHVLGIKFREDGIYYIVETPNNFGVISMEKVKIIKQ